MMAMVGLSKTDRSQGGGRFHLASIDLDSKLRQLWEEHRPDLLLVGDGSGCQAKDPCGWSCLAYDGVDVTEHYGYANHGTNNLAELLPYLFALWFYASKKLSRVVCISDSEVTVKCGNKQYSRNCNQCFWEGIKFFEEKGVTFLWKWVPRNSSEVAKWADLKSKQQRKLCPQNCSVRQ